MDDCIATIDELEAEIAAETLVMEDLKMEAMISFSSEDIDRMRAKDDFSRFKKTFLNMGSPMACQAI